MIDQLIVPHGLKKAANGVSLSLNGVSMYNEVGGVVDGLRVVVVIGSLC